MNNGTLFSDISPQTPTYEGAAQQYAEIRRLLDAAQTKEQRLRAFAQWEQLRRQIESWSSLTMLRFSQDTQNASYSAARQYCDALLPRLTELEVGVKRTLLAPQHREDIEQIVGRHAFDLWRCDIAAFDPAITGDLQREATLTARYTELLASADLPFDGQRLNLQTIKRFTQDPDRAVRHAAEQVRWSFFGEHKSELDDLYGDLVRLRHSMARKLGYGDYIGLGYRRMRRVDYDDADVERYRDEIVRTVVPIAQEIITRKADKLGLKEAMYWDESVSDPRGNAIPLGDHDWILARAQEMFADMDASLGQFYRMMLDRHLMDMRNRPSKAGGGFCTSFPSYAVPYIFANFNGTKDDVDVLIHEIGHAFQNWQSRDRAVTDYFWPTSESAEIHSMSMEYFTWPYMERLFGPQAAAYRKEHLAEALLFLPYGAAVDHFQHLVYAQPDATPAQRNAMWQQMEARYLPWRRYGDIAYPAGGGLWQAKQHIYVSPLYYVDYTLASCCALQFWAKSQGDYGAALADYVALCRRGGEAPFRELTRSAGLQSPFEPGAMEHVVAHAREALAL
ncbi:MAG: M3 family oligoendopeptidase [Candidatus Eremiobacteraeota bacterium]|nr:M3 family oligoendopeptidase [Candidatus Eremiobacteraeota bacterium]MBC5828493.1 M3 family oligoendopeptidase [Candidatus Eremiobacteraeota bacterium]